MEEKPLILVTNDDGVHAAGIKALAEALRDVGEVYVVAPDVERSASGQSGSKDNRKYDDQGAERRPAHLDDEGPGADVAHSLNLAERPYPTLVEDQERTYKVNGTPADCVYLAIRLEDFLPRAPDLVVSGINHGPNLGDDTYRSGTAAGAREAAFVGLPSIALSLAVARPGWSLLKRKGPDFKSATDYGVKLARCVLEKRLHIPERNFLNVNFPEEISQKKQPRVTAQEPPSRGLEQDIDDRPERRAVVRVPPLTDRNALTLGHVSVTLIQTDATNYRGWSRLDQELPDLSTESPPLEREG